MGAAEIPSPGMACRPDGHVSICPECGAEQPVKVTERKNPRAEFVLARDASGEPTEVTYGTVAVYDLSRYERHYREAH